MSEISVIIPVYNKIKHIEDTVRSVLVQTYEDFELLLIDDGSTDGSGAKCEELSLTDTRIRVLHCDNRGVSAARNTGLKNASGRYISFIDADDRIDKTFLEKLHASMLSEDAQMATCGYYEVGNGKINIHLYRDLGTGNRLFDHIREDMFCILWNKLFVKERIKHLFEEGLSTCEDSIFCIRYYLDSDPKIAIVDEALYEYSPYGEGLSSTYRDNAFCGINKLLIVNRKLSARIEDECLRNLALHHIYKVYFYGVYTYIFGNLCKGPADAYKLSVIDRILKDKVYRKIIGYLIGKTGKLKDAEKNSVEEKLIILFSFLKMKRMIFLLSKAKKCLGPLKNRL
ncbi:MAG: glycosyltransferase family 2 protein [Lachnospiraceae bacterium]|nr:glycosyltransferase family 2 protein [Lachnospiraceae bacterium]MBP5761998.1 glycosyltransferase family 2 protein [Lachnospiraceae bacterium]